MKAVLLMSDHPNQRALASKLASACDLAAIVLSKNLPNRKRKVPREAARVLLNRIEGQFLATPFVDAWNHMRDRYEAGAPRWPTERVVSVPNVNADDTVRTIRAHAPDYVLVSGTNLVGSAIIRAAQERSGVLELHTGIAPYVKGGPNCTNWCLAEGLYHLIGSTVMWLDRGLGADCVLATERTPLDGTEDLDALHWKVMEHAHDLFVRVVRALARGESLPRVPQESIAPGRTFYAREWSALPMVRARLNFRRWSPDLLASDAMKRDAARLKLFPIRA